jgi:hypothetical protein
MLQNLEFEIGNLILRKFFTRTRNTLPVIFEVGSGNFAGFLRIAGNFPVL